MKNYSFYLLWLPKYFDEYYKCNKSSEATSNSFTKNLSNFLDTNPNFNNIKIKIFDKKCESNTDQELKNIEFMAESEATALGYWGRITFTIKKNNQKVTIIFNQFGFYYFEFFSDNKVDKESDIEIIKLFFQEQKTEKTGITYYPLLTETQIDVLTETFLNVHLNHRAFNKKIGHNRPTSIEEFVEEALYDTALSHINFREEFIQNKIASLEEYQIKKDEYYDFKTLIHAYQKVQNTSNSIIYIIKDSFKKLVQHSQTEDEYVKKTYQKIILDHYEEKAIETFLNTVVSAKYFDRITKSIKEVREGLTGKIIFMTPQDTQNIETNFQNNEVFQSWSKEQIENYIQLLISKKPLFLKIDNALKSSYYVTVGNISALNHMDEKEDIAHLLHYNEWKSLLEYFFETTKSLKDILHLSHANRTFNELEEIKHYESNNHDKEEILSLIKNNENKLGTTEDSKTLIMVFAILATMFVAIPDMIGSIGTFKDFFQDNKQNMFAPSIFDFDKEWSNALVFALIFYSPFVIFVVLIFRQNILKGINFFRKKWKNEFVSLFKKFTLTSPDDFDLLEHRSSESVKSHTNGRLRKVEIDYQEHISTHRFVRYLEKREITPCKWSNTTFTLLPELCSLETLSSSDQKLYKHLKKNRTTKFSINRIDKTKIKVNMSYRINRIPIEKFFNYYEQKDSYINFYKECCTKDDQECQDNKCKKINSPEVIKRLKKEFKGIDAELSFVGIYSFVLVSKTLDHSHEKIFELSKDSFRVYFHIDKYPIKYYKEKFELRNDKNSKENKSLNCLQPYDAISEMIYLVFIGRLKGFNHKMNQKE